jgi:hypothetical protein
MPRKSAAALSVLPLPETRPKPPPAPRELTPTQAKLWDDIVASRPADWFTGGANAILLVALVRHADAANTIAGLMAEADPLDRRYRLLSVMAVRQSAMVAQLASKLRLLPANLYRSTQAVPTASTRTPPWGRHL